MKILTSGKSFRSLLWLFAYCLLVTLFSLFIFLSHNNNNNNNNNINNNNNNSSNNNNNISNNSSSNSQSSAANRKLNDIINNNNNNKYGVSYNNNNNNNNNNVEQTTFKMHNKTRTNDLKHTSSLEDLPRMEFLNHPLKQPRKNKKRGKNANEKLHDGSRDDSTHPSLNQSNYGDNKNNNNNNRSSNIQRLSTTSRHHHQQQRQHKQQNIPRTAHIVWFYPNSTVFRFHQALSLLSVQKFFRPSKIFFWHDSLPTGTWWMFACQSIAHLLFVPLERPRQVFNWTVSVPEHQSDVARIQLLRKYGGLYVDLDVILLRDLGPLFQHEVTMGAETPDILGSGFIMARPDAPFLELWLDSYRTDFDDSDWNRHSTKVPMELARRHPGLIHVEWFTINRPNWFERKWLYEVGRLWDWSGNYAVHLWYREHNVEYSPQSIRTLNTTVAEIFRFIYYQSPKLLED